MPRDGSGIYVKPFPDVVEGTTIESTVHNGTVADVEYDLNTPRPIVAGGTGANNARDAMINLSGEIANQGPVTNYDTFPFVPGTFFSNPGATGAPPSGGTAADYFKGVVYGIPGNSLTLDCEALSLPHTRYSRTMVGGMWEAWKTRAGSTADLDAAYVNVAGDTMTGTLRIGTTSPVIALDKAASGQTNVVYGTLNATLARWAMHLGDAVVEGGGNSGSNFVISRFNNAGAQIDNPLSIDRASGNVTIPNQIVVNGGVYAGAVGAAGSYYFGSSGTKSLNYDGATFVLAGGNLQTSNGILAAGIIWSITAPTTGSFAFGNTGTKYLQYDGANFTLVGGALAIGGGPVSGTLPGDLQVARGSNTGLIQFGTAGTKYLHFDGAAFTLAGGSNFNVQNSALTVGGIVYAINAGAAKNGSYVFGSDGSKYLTCDGANYAFAAGNLGVAGQITANSAKVIAGTNVVAAGGGLIMNAAETVFFKYAQAGETTAYSWNNVTQTYWRASDNAFIHLGPAFKPGGGAWADSSDSRIKNELGEYPRGLAEIAALRPVYYTYKGNDTDAPPEHNKDADGEYVSKEALTVPYPNSNHRAAAESATKYAGLIAQEVEAIFPEMVTKRSGYIDGELVDDLRNLDTTPLVFALINAVKELTARLEALEGGGAARRR